MSTHWKDVTCPNLSSSLSCLAMRDLAMKEYEENKTQLDYLLNDPSCERYHAMFDKGQLYGNTLSRRLCFTHDPSLKQGVYQDQYKASFTEQYDQWTRRKDITKQGPVLGKEINADIWNNMTDDGSAILKCGTGGNTQTFLGNTGIPYGISASEQSSVPSNFLEQMGCCLK